MNNPNLNQLESEVEEKYARQAKKKNKKMKVSGSNVRKLAKIIHDKQNI